MSLLDASTIAGNAEVVRRGYAAFNTADMDTLTELIDENASWHTPGRSPIAGDYRGRDAVFGQFGRYGGETGGTFKAELEQVFTCEDGRVIGLHHNSAERERQASRHRLLHRLRGRGRPRHVGAGALLRSRQLGRVLVVAPPEPARQAVATPGRAGKPPQLRGLPREKGTAGVGGRREPGRSPC